MNRLANTTTRTAGFIAGLSALVLSTLISVPSRPVLATKTSAEPLTSSPDDGELKLVVALFRHGVRSPTPDFWQQAADQSSRDKWPSLNDWTVMPTQSECDDAPPVPKGWGYLTVRGEALAQGLGVYYGKHYRQEAWPGGFNVYLWADALNQRTRATARALAAGFSSAGIAPAKVTVGSLSPCQPDPLFHPFQLNCGKPDHDKLQRFANEITRDGSKWVNTTYRPEFSQLYDVLDCYDKTRCLRPLKLDTDNLVNTCIVYSSTCKAPLSWKSQFTYASSASESFLLGYANAMEARKVGWGKVNPPSDTVRQKMRDMLKLHEFYFDKTDRFVREDEDTDHYLASIQGSNLIREILDQIRRKIGQPRKGSCPRATAQSDFVGLIGHDTNLATVGALLGLNWRFDDPALPADTRDLPANDALPAGALVFELRQRSDGTYFVRIEYVAQGLSQMRYGPADRPFRIPVDGSACLQTRPCQIPLKNFEDLVKQRGLPEFLSTCTLQNPPQQTCLALPSRTTKKTKPRRAEAAERESAAATRPIHAAHTNRV